MWACCVFIIVWTKTWTLPDRWKTGAFISQIFSSGSSDLTCNQRPIAIFHLAHRFFFFFSKIKYDFMFLAQNHNLQIIPGLWQTVQMWHPLPLDPWTGWVKALKSPNRENKKRICENYKSKDIWGVVIKKHVLSIGPEAIIICGSRFGLGNPSHRISCPNVGCRDQARPKQELPLWSIKTYRLITHNISEEEVKVEKGYGHLEERRWSLI